MKDMCTIIHPDKGDVIIHTLMDGISLDEEFRVHSELIHAFPNNQVIAVPDTEMIDKLDKKSTVELLQAMIHLIEGYE